MMDAQTFVETIFSWGLYLGAALGIGLFILATIYRAIGNENYKRAYLASLIALILAVSGWDAVKQLAGTVDASIFPHYSALYICNYFLLKYKTFCWHLSPLFRIIDL